MQLTPEKIDDFSNQYRGSEEERQAVLDSFERCNANMTAVFDHVMCSDAAMDSHRFMDIVDKAIKDGTLKSCSHYKKWRTEVSKRKRPANPLKPKKASKKKAADDEALVAAIQKRVCLFDA